MRRLTRYQKRLVDEVEVVIRPFRNTTPADRALLRWAECNLRSENEEDAQSAEYALIVLRMLYQLRNEAKTTPTEVAVL